MPPTPLLILLLAIATYAQTPLYDKRDGKTYKTVKIGTQIWMAENLNYNAEGSDCYNNLKNCEIYGRLYNWEIARKSCPNGWRLPGDADWKTLIATVNGDGEILNAKSGWEKCSRNGTDDYGFSALPGGSTFYDYSYDIGRGGYWWSASEHNNYEAYR